MDVLIAGELPGVVEEDGMVVHGEAVGKLELVELLDVDKLELVELLDVEKLELVGLIDVGAAVMLK